MTKKYLSLIIFSLIFISIIVPGVLGAMNCINYNDDPTQKRCTEYKTQVYNTTVPRINVTFEDWISITNYKLYKVASLGSPFPEDPFTVTNEFTPVNMSEDENGLYVPDRHVSDGKYIFRLEAYNAPNINIDVAVMFKINGTGMDFWVNKPENKHVNSSQGEKPNFAVTNKSSFFFELKTQRDVDECRFSIWGIEGTTPLAQAYEQDMMSEDNFTANTSDKTKAYISAFNISKYYPGYNFDGELKMLYIICKEPQGKYSYGEIMVGVDFTSPVISAYAIPGEVIDSSSRKTNMTISTDDRSACTIKMTAPVPFPELPNINRSLSYDFKSIDDFLKVYSETLKFGYSPNNVDFKFNVTCDNLANLRSSTEVIVKVNLTMEQSFEYYSPSSLTNKTTIIVNGSVSIYENVTCAASLNKTSTFTQLTATQIYMPGGRKVYTGTLSGVKEGDNTVYVNCTYMGTSFSEKDFVADTISPTAPNITMAAKSCSLTEINAELDSIDDGTGVDKYYYNLTLQEDPDGDYFEYGVSNSGEISVNINGDDIENRTYTLSAYAIDDAGNRGAVKTGIIQVTGTDIPQCDDTPPAIAITKFQDNSSNVFWKVKVNCSDPGGSGCRNDIRYGLNQTVAGACTPTQTGQLGVPITISNTSKFCATVFDNNNNSKSNFLTVTILVPVGCTNLIRDGTESDVDCGGTCPKCALNKSCLFNTDCFTNYCLNGRCSIASCSDNITNGEETGKDCGGTCTPCQIGGGCESDYDCATLNCAAGLCAAASCTDTKKDGVETDIDCGGTCPVCQRLKSCLLNTDCATGYCEPASKVCNLNPSIDTDGDGLPDYWEEKYCGTFTGCNPGDDLDGDEYTNLEEFKAGTNPNDSSSHPAGSKFSINSLKRNMPSLIFFILGILLVIVGIIIKALEVIEQQKNQANLDDGEMRETISQIPKITSLEHAETKVTEDKDTIALKQQARIKNVKMRELDKKKVFNQFDGEKKPLEDKKTTDKKTTEEQKKEASKPENKESKEQTEEYVELGTLQKKTEPKEEDSFSKLKKITGQKKETEIPSTEKKKESAEKEDKKQKKDDEVFNKLKNLSKQK